MDKLMKTQLITALAALGMLTSVSAYAVPGEPFSTSNAELICKINSDSKSRSHSTSGFTAYAGNYSINNGGAVVQSGTLKSILENNPVFVTSAGGNIRNIPCTAAVAEVQRYLAGAYLSGFEGLGPEAIVTALVNLNTSNPGVTRLDDDTIVYTWTVVIPAYNEAE
jgi:hypothetical protein